MGLTSRYTPRNVDLLADGVVEARADGGDLAGRGGEGDKGDEVLHD